MADPRDTDGSRREPARTAWRLAQAATWILGAGIFAALVLAPDFGLRLFFGVVVPAAPALLAFVPGVWRNVCPLATTALLPDAIGLSKAGELSREHRGHLRLLGILAIFVIVPLRHALFDVNGRATALLLASVAIVAVVLGIRFARKSAWCSGLCPIHAVECLYGSRPLATVANAHCPTCRHCSVPCPDATTKGHSLLEGRSSVDRLAGIFFVGGFPGFVWGWFQVPDAREASVSLAATYGRPLGTLAVSLAVFIAARALLPRRHEQILVRTFAFAAITAYYWHRVPMLVGFGRFPGDGMLVDLRSVLPAWFPLASRIASTGLLAWWFMLRRAQPLPWSDRPRVLLVRALVAESRPIRRSRSS